ncbi:MAG TPA: TonB-dependent receptor [Pyrinomonadaceae bacterium]|nr:TonB-dependent receptor [Pyrinomonadaceae bacterium]
MKNRHRFISASILVMLVTLITHTNANAQGGVTIEGRVTDERGSAVAVAEIRLSSRTGFQLIAKTDSSGDYSFQNVKTGSYILEVNASGFAAITSEEIQLGSDPVKQDFRLPVASVNENVVVIAAGIPQRTDEVSKAVTILEDREIESKREVSLAEALRGTPGLRVQQQGSPGAVTSLRFRGQRNFDTALLIDGLRVRDSADINGSALPFITDLTANDLDRVELLRGSGSSIYGTNAIGGVINLVPKPGAGDPRFEAGFEAGSLGLFRSRIQGSGGIRQQAGFSFGLTRLDVRDGVDGQDLYGNTSGAGRLQVSLSPSVDLAANFYGTTSNAITNNSPQPLAASFTPTQPFPRAVEGVTFHPDFNNPDQGRRNSIWAASIRFTQRINETVSYTVAYQKVSTRRRNYNGLDFDSRFIALVPFGEFEFTGINNGGTDTLDARTNFRAGKSNLLTAGFEFERESLFQQFMSAFGAPAGTTDRQRTFAVFAQDQIVLFDGRLQVSIGARKQWFKIRANDRPGFLGQINAKSSVAGDGSIAYFFPSSGTKLRGHVGNGFRAPSLFERFGEGAFQNTFVRFGDPTLRAEQSIAVDGGLDQRLADNRLAFGFTYFYTRLQRVIDFKDFRSFFNPTGDPDPLGLDRTGGYLNFPGGISRGIEAYVEAAPFRGTTIRSAYTYTNADRFVPGAGSLPQFVTPKHMYGLSASQRYRAFLVSLDINHTGDYISRVFPVDLTFDGYTKIDLFLSYEKALNDRVVMTLFGGAENLLDQRYFENGFRAPGAMGRGGIKVRF